MRPATTPPKTRTRHTGFRRHYGAMSVDPDLLVPELSGPDGGNRGGAAGRVGVDGVEQGQGIGG